MDVEHVLTTPVVPCGNNVAVTWAEFKVDVDVVQVVINVAYGEFVETMGEAFIQHRTLLTDCRLAIGKLIEDAMLLTMINDMDRYSPHWYACVETVHGLCSVIDDQLLATLVDKTMFMYAKAQLEGRVVDDDE